MRTNNTNVLAMAREAADDYIAHGDLNQAVAKIAAANELNPHQIQRVVETANHEVNARTYKSAKDKRFALKLASADEVMALLNITKDDEEATKEASADDFFTLKRSTKTASAYASPHRYRAMGGNEGMKQAVLADLKLIEAEVVKQARELRTYQYEAKVEAEQALNKFADEVRRLILEEHIPLQDMYKAACTLFPEEEQPVVQAIFESVKTANAKRANALEGKEYRAFDGSDYKSLGGKIVNGNQPLFIHLHVVNNGLRSDRCCSIASEGYNTLHSGIVKAIHALKTNKDVDDYIAREVQSFANNVRKGVKFAMEHIWQHQKSDTWFAKTAGFGPVARTVEQASRVFQILNQLFGVGKTGVTMGRDFLRDLTAPAVIRPGHAFSTAGMQEAAPQHGM